MGKYRFRLSDMIPNAWFYKLKDMSNSRKQNNRNPTSSASKKPPLSQPTYSTTIANTTGSVNNLYNPTKPSKKKPKRKTIYKPSPSPHNLSLFSSLESSPDYGFHHHHPDDFVSPSDAHSDSSTSDIIIDMKNVSFTNQSERKLEVELPPILTKPKLKSQKVNHTEAFPLEQREEPNSLSVKIVKDRPKKTNGVVKRSSVSSKGIRIRAKSPKVELEGHGRKSGVSSRGLKYKKNRGFSESFAFVKSSVDPQRDFRESMREMIVENGIRNCKDLEELLACYLSLNSVEYHRLIVKAFEQIWFDLAEIPTPNSLDY